MNDYGFVIIQSILLFQRMYHELINHDVGGAADDEEHGFSHVFVFKPVSGGFSTGFIMKMGIDQPGIDARHFDAEWPDFFT